MATKEEGEPKSTKVIRKVKNPETFRERAVKASEQEAQPKRSHKLRNAAGRPVRPVVGGAKRVGQNKVFRAITSPIRLIGRVLFPKYFRNSYRELKQVKWPNRRESRQLTFAVLMFSLAFGVVVALVDYGLDKLFREVLLK